jgi:predicted permease
MAVLAGLVPVFLVLAAGAVARRTGMLPEAAATGLNRLVANIALPAFFLLKVGTTPLEVSFSVHSVVVTSAAVVLTAVGVLLLARLRGLPLRQQGVLSQAAMRGNLAYVAFPVVRAAAGEAGLRQAVVTSAILILLMNLLAVAVLEASRDQRGGGLRLAARVAANPMVAAALVGVVLAAFHWRPWAWLEGTLAVLSDFALPGALLALGGQLGVSRWSGVWRLTATASFIKLIATPALGWWALTALGADSFETSVGVLLLAAPTAVASYPVAAELGGDTDLAGACVLATTVASFLTYPAWTMLLSA